jgi:hypothetical protein
MEAWVDALPNVEPAWRDVGTMSDYRMLLTLDQARALVARLDEIGLAARADGAGSTDPAARPVSFQFQVLPSLHAVLDRDQPDDGDSD